MLEKLKKNRLFSAVFNVVARFGDHDVAGIAAQTTFYLVLSLFPLIMLVVSVISRANISVDPEYLSTVVPESVVSIISLVAEASAPSLHNTGIITLLLAVWSASAGIWGLMRGIYRAHQQKRLESVIWGRIISVIFMVGFLVAMLLSLALLVFGQLILSSLLTGLDTGSMMLLDVFRTASTALLIFLFMFALYYFTPGVHLKAKDVVFGAAFTSAGWIIFSRLFELYMRNFSKYSALYGSLGVVLGLVIWLYSICFIILTGAELNSIIIERKSKR